MSSGSTRPPLLLAGSPKLVPCPTPDASPLLAAFCLSLRRDKYRDGFLTLPRFAKKPVGFVRPLCSLCGRRGCCAPTCKGVLASTVRFVLVGCAAGDFVVVLGFLRIESSPNPLIWSGSEFGWALCRTLCFLALRISLNWSFQALCSSENVGESCAGGW